MRPVSPPSRGRRPKPGLMRQHLTCVQAALAVCGGKAEGAELGSQTLVFEPGRVRAGRGAALLDEGLSVPALSGRQAA